MPLATPEEFEDRSAREATLQELARKNEALRQKSREAARMSREVARANETLQTWLERLDQANRNLSALYDINRILTQTLDQSDVLNLALERLESLVGGRGARQHRLAICLLSPDRRQLFLTASRGAGRRREARTSGQAVAPGQAAFLGGADPGETLDLDAVPAAVRERLLEEGEPVFVDDVARMPALAPLLAGRRIRSLYAWPILVGGEAIGVLVVGCPQPEGLGEEERRLVSTVAGQVAVAVGNARLYHQALLDADLLEAVIRSMRDGMITLDWEMRITSMNTAAEDLTGWTADEVVGRPAPEVFRGAGGEGYGLSPSLTPLADILASPELSERGLSAECVLQARDGTEIYVDCTHSIFSVKGTPVGGVAVFRDVTQKVELAQQKTDYVAGLSHDIRTPLSAIKGYALTLIRHEAQLEAGTRREFLTVINAEIDRLARLLDNLLNFSRMEAGRLIATPAPFDLPPVVKRVMDLHALTTRKHTLLLAMESGFPRVYADQDQVEQVLNNLISNAIKYSPRGGDIHVSLEKFQEDGRELARVTVEDEGVGIEPEQLSQLFQRYRRLQNHATRKVSGNGLGLYITRNLVEANGGRVEVASDLGQGSCFTFTLPFVTPGS